MFTITSQFIQKLKENDSELKYNFGTISLVQNDTESSNFKRTKPVHFILNLDVSSSMSKNIDYLRTVAKRCVDYIGSKQEIMDSYVTINTFSNSVTEYVKYKKINTTNLPEILVSIDKITANGCTNYQEPLSIVHHQHNALATSLEHSESDVECYHIFFTDGMPNTGSFDPEQLEYYHRSYINTYFVGLGESIETTYLMSLTEKFSGEYFSISTGEDIQYAYADIMNNIVSSNVSELTLSSEAQHLELYNESTNSWESSYKIARYCSNITKNVHVRIPWTCDSHEYTILLSYKNAIHNTQHFQTCDMIYDSSQTTTKESRNPSQVQMLLRQKVMEFQYFVISKQLEYNEIYRKKYSITNETMDITLLVENIQSFYDDEYPKTPLTRVLLEDAKFLEQISSRPSSGGILPQVDIFTTHTPIRSDVYGSYDDISCSSFDNPPPPPPLMNTNSHIPFTTSGTFGITGLPEPPSLQRNISVGLSRMQSHTRQRSVGYNFTQDPYNVQLSDSPTNSPILQRMNGRSVESSTLENCSFMMSPYATPQTQQEIDDFVHDS
jgi:hypothetical protein